MFEKRKSLNKVLSLSEIVFYRAEHPFCYLCVSIDLSVNQE